MLKHLLEYNVVTGPQEKNTSYSALEGLRRMMLGEQLTLKGDFLKDGTAAHEMLFKNDSSTFKTLPKEKQKLVEAWVTKLKAHPVVQELMKDSISEEKQYGKLFGVEFAYILDCKQIHKNRGWDLKTTNCNTQKEFEEKAFMLGYHKQSYLYKTLEQLKDFYFIAIQKRYPYNIFIIDTSKWKLEELYARDEIEFLCHFYSKYGYLTGETTLEKVKPNSVNKMEGKEAIREMLQQLGKMLEAKKQIKKYTTAYHREGKALIKLSRKFPKKDLPLYKEKIQTIIKK